MGNIVIALRLCLISALIDLEWDISYFSLWKMIWKKKSYLFDKRITFTIKVTFKYYSMQSHPYFDNGNARSGPLSPLSKQRDPVT